MITHSMSKKDYLEVLESKGGFCSFCNMFVDEGIPIDNYGCECPLCNKKGMLGVKAALEMGFIEVKD